MTAKLRMEGITKTFPGVKALDDISIAVAAGEVLGLIGVNGAGKSTLMNILGGIYKPDAGTISIDGRLVTLRNPTDADHAGIAFIHQELIYFPTLSVADNMFLSRLPAGRLPFTVNRRMARSKATEALALLGSSIRPTAIVEDLSVGEKQVVEIARAIATGSDIVIFDEPSSSLSLKEKEALFAMVRKLRDEGKAVIYISHFLDEINDFCDSYAVLRNGRMVGQGRVEHTAKEEIIELIVGAEMAAPTDRTRQTSDESILYVNGIVRGELLRGVNLEMRRGEVLGLWGLMGSGRTELIRTILGLDSKDKGELRITDESGTYSITSEELLARTAYVTESRRTDGLFLDEPIWKNISATTLNEFARGHLRVLDKASEADRAKKMIDKIRIKTPDHRTKVANLSGGNQQKVVFAKWLGAQPEFLVLDEPTRGVDVGAKREIGALVSSLAEAGTSVLLVTSEIEEMMALTDRILVLRDGVIATEFTGNAISESALMTAAMGTDPIHE